MEGEIHVGEKENGPEESGTVLDLLAAFWL